MCCCGGLIGVIEDCVSILDLKILFFSDGLVRMGGNVFKGGIGVGMGELLWGWFVVWVVFECGDLFVVDGLFFLKVLLRNLVFICLVKLVKFDV